MILPKYCGFIILLFAVILIDCSSLPMGMQSVPAKKLACKPECVYKAIHELYPDNSSIQIDSLDHVVNFVVILPNFTKSKWLEMRVEITNGELLAQGTNRAPSTTATVSHIQALVDSIAAEIVNKAIINPECVQHE